MSRPDPAPPVDVQTAVSHRCMPLDAFLCWQYDKASLAFPLWMLEYLTVQPKGARVEFNYPENGPTAVLEQGDWVVLFDGEEQLVSVLTPEEFATRFRCVFQ